jgi:hypothetical protein
MRGQEARNEPARTRHPDPFLVARVSERVVYGDAVRRLRDGHHLRWTQGNV